MQNRTIVQSSKTGSLQLVLVEMNESESAYVVERFPCYGAYPEFVARVVDSHFCSNESWKRAVAETWACFSWR